MTSGEKASICDVPGKHIITLPGGRQEVSRCNTRGEPQGTFQGMLDHVHLMNKAANSVFKTQRKRHPNSKIETCTY